MASEGHKDTVTGTTTTGHEWDGIHELNTPLPRWWLWTFYASIIWAIGYWVVYPSWPLVTSYTQGLTGWHAREAIIEDLAALEAQRGPMTAKIAATPLAEIAANPQLLAFARAQGKAAFADNCAPCHGSGGAGAVGYPNLNDDEWLWGGTLDDVHRTVEVGIRAAHKDTRDNRMPAFGRDGMLKLDEIVKLANVVRAAAGLPTRKGVDLAAGKALFTTNCAGCHGEDAKGSSELGAPNLTDAIWLYGSDEATIIDVITNARAGVMPAWSGRLDPVTIKALTVYVHTLGGGK
jgi:cytochrome c oxidase cbb3-type subunit III